jgi:hypothetical protein
MVIHEFNENLALTRRGLIFFYRHRGGIAGYRYRLDEAPATNLRIPSRLDRLTDTLTFQGRNLDAILRAKRLRVSAITLAGGENFDDIDLNGLTRARADMLNGCNVRSGMPLPEPRPDAVGGSNEHPITEIFREIYDIPLHERRFWQPNSVPVDDELRAVQ